ncbi:MAG: transposase [Oleispira sp.]
MVKIAENKPNYKGSWLEQFLVRWGKNVAAVALANKNARTVWTLLVHDKNYDSNHGQQAA